MVENIPIICGPTGSGKTGCALKLAEQFDIDIINADSRQIIRHLDIGTAKPTAEERKKVDFHLVDIVEPGERYSAFRFIEDAQLAIASILGRGRIPIIVGGTGLYLKALSDGVVEVENQDMDIRNKLQADMDKLGPQAMHERLETVDPLEAARIHPNNKMRVIRALELFEVTGKCKSELVTTGVYCKPPYDFSYFCLQPEREVLYQRINERVEQMIAAGWLDEVKTLVQNGYSEAIRRARVIGYDELLDHIEGKRSLEEVIAMIKQNHRRYAKRQITWYRHQVECHYFETGQALTGNLGQELRRKPLS